MSNTSSVLELLKSNRFLHLGTCKDNVPSVSLMNFSLVQPEGGDRPVIILASPRDTVKLENIQANPNVSLLIHDYVTPSSSEGTNLASYLQKINQSELSQRSATISGRARIAQGDEAEYFRKKHLQAHKDAACFIDNADIIVVEMDRGKIADSRNNITQFDIN